MENTFKLKQLKLFFKNFIYENLGVLHILFSSIVVVLLVFHRSIHWHFLIKKKKKIKKKIGPSYQQLEKILISHLNHFSIWERYGKLYAKKHFFDEIECFCSDFTRRDIYFSKAQRSQYISASKHVFKHYVLVVSMVFILIEYWDTVTM